MDPLSDSLRTKVEASANAVGDWNDNKFFFTRKSLVDVVVTDETGMTDGAVEDRIDSLDGTLNDVDLSGGSGNRTPLKQQKTMI